VQVIPVAVVATLQDKHNTPCFTKRKLTVDLILAGRHVLDCLTVQNKALPSFEISGAI